MRASTFLPTCGLLAVAALAAGCNPTYNWREVHSQEGGYKILFPAKPSTHTRPVDLNGLRIDMTMMGAQVEGTTFAVGMGIAPDAATAQAALPAMRHALLRNIGAAESPAAPDAKGRLSLDVTGSANGQAMRLLGRFEARGPRFYQVIVVGKQSELKPEQAEQFLTSFAPY